MADNTVEQSKSMMERLHALEMKAANAAMAAAFDAAAMHAVTTVLAAATTAG